MNNISDVAAGNNVITWGIVNHALVRLSENVGLVEVVESMYNAFLRLCASHTRTVYQYNYPNKTDPNTVLIKQNGAWSIVTLSHPMTHFVEMATVNMVDLVVNLTLQNAAIFLLPRFADLKLCFDNMTHTRKIELLRTYET